MTLTISLPADAEITLRERANAVGQDLTQYVEQLIVREVGTSPAAIEAMDDEYQRGYELIPENTDDVKGMLPYIVVGEWE